MIYYVYLISMATTLFQSENIRITMLYRTGVKYYLHIIFIIFTCSYATYLNVSLEINLKGPNINSLKLSSTMLRQLSLYFVLPSHIVVSQKLKYITEQKSTQIFSCENWINSIGDCLFYQKQISFPRKCAKISQGTG